MNTLIVKRDKIEQAAVRGRITPSDCISFSLLFLICVELFIGGGGDLFSFSIGSVRITLRMVLFVLALVKFVVFDGCRLFKKTEITRMVLLILFLCVVSFLIGTILNSFSRSFDNLKTYLYILMYFPIINYSKSRFASFSFLGKVLMFCSVLVSLFSIYIFVSINILGVDIYSLRTSLANYSVDLLIRNNGGFVYAGHLFCVISAFYALSYLLFKKTNPVYLAIFAINAVAIFLSSTRGLIITFIFIILIIMLYSMKNSRRRILVFFTVILTSVFLVIVLKNVDLTRFSSFDDQSVNIRTSVINSSLNDFFIDPLFGIGFGYTYPGREWSNSFEISLFDILIKQGIVGLLMWMVFIALIFKEIVRVHKTIKTDNLEYIFSITSVISVVLISFTNPYLNNSVGLSVFFLVLMCLFNRERYADAK